jgi:hypothetical protein
VARASADGSFWFAIQTNHTIHARPMTALTAMTTMNPGLLA